MEAGAQKWSPKGTQSGSRTGLPLGSPGAQKHNEFKGFWSFLASQRAPNLGSFLDPRILGIFKKKKELEKPKRENDNLKEPESKNPGNN